MKAWPILFLFVLLPVNIFSQELSLTGGSSLSYLHTKQWLRISDSLNNYTYTEDNTLLLGIDAWIDATFVELHGSYFHNVDSTTRLFEGEGSTNQGLQKIPSTTAIFAWGAMLKYPLIFHSIKLAPAIGFTYMSMLDYERDQTPLTSPDLWTELPSELDDLYLHGGLTLDIKLNDSLALRFSGMYGFNLNSQKQTAINYAKTLSLDLTDGGTMVNLSVGLGYTL